MDELLRRFNEAHVRYLIVGGQAMRLAGMPRFSVAAGPGKAECETGGFGLLRKVNPASVGLLEGQVNQPLYVRVSGRGRAVGGALWGCAHRQQERLTPGLTRPR